MNEFEKNDEVIKRFEEMLQTSNNYFFDIDDFLDIIDEYISVANYVLAHKAIQIALEQYENNVDILLYKAELLSLLDDLPRAEEIIAHIKLIAPDRGEIPLLEAELYSRKLMHKNAVEALKRALAVVQDKTEVYDLLTIEYLYLEDYHAALKTAMKCLEIDGENVTALYNAVTCYDFLNEYEKAVVFLENYVGKYPFSEVAWSLLGKKYIEKKQYQKAINALDYAIAIDDQFLGAYYDQAFAYNKLGDYKKAIQLYELTLEVVDPSAFTFYHMAKLYEKLNDETTAAVHYLKAVNEDPGHYKSWIKLIELKIKSNAIEHAFELAEKAIELSENQELFELLAKIQIQRDQPGKAIEALEKSLSLGEMRLPVVMQLADLYYENNLPGKYKEILLEAQKHFPESVALKNKMMKRHN